LCVWADRQYRYATQTLRVISISTMLKSSEKAAIIVNSATAELGIGIFNKVQCYELSSCLIHLETCFNSNHFIGDDNIINPFDITQLRLDLIGM
jgi:hypothetical protein